MNSKFGSINVETGTSSEGYMEDGEMKFKKTPWYKRLFAKKPVKEVFMGTCKWGNDKMEIELCIYKKFNPYTNETYEIYANHSQYGKFSFDINAFEQMGKLVEI